MGRGITVPRSNHSSVIIESKILVFGGISIEPLS